ncbi:MAG: DUF58 domain-containing protein [Prevotellaceae bacterium]|nr:DUF58 domain-containing protein [Prevotellaceae bacterium]
MKVRKVDVFCQGVKYVRSKMFVRITFFIVILFVIFVREYVAAGASEKVNDIAFLLLKSSMFVFGVIILFSIITILIPYFAYRKSKAKPKVKFTYTGDNEVICEVVCDKLLFPFAGAVKVGLTFDKQYDAMVVLKRLKHKQAYGKKELTLPNIKSYDLDTITLFFQDFFRMFSFKIEFNHKVSVVILPVSENDIELSKVVHTTDKDEIRTNTVHRKEGELLHFKHFESSDDIRRIVWPVYARTKELIVRMIEMHSIYASRIDMYASFCNNYRNLLNKTISDAFLNNYKTGIWEVYKSLKKDNEVCFIPDQKSKIAVEYQHEISAQISGMDWHSNKIEEYLGEGKISVVCISSLIPSQDTEKMLDRLDANTIVIFTSLKSSIEKISVKDVLKEIFTIPQEKKVNWRWLFSTSRKKILDNDKAVRNALISRNLSYIEI